LVFDRCTCQDAKCGPTPKNDPSQLPSRLRASRASGVGYPQNQKQIPRARAALGMTTFSDSCDTDGSPSWLLGSCKQENPQGLRQTTSERPGLQPGLKRKKLRRQGEFRDAATGPTLKNERWGTRKGKDGFLATEEPQGLRQTTSERPGLQRQDPPFRKGGAPEKAKADTSGLLFSAKAWLWLSGPRNDNLT